MYGGISQLDHSYEVRRRRRFPEKYQRPLTQREKDIINAIKDGATEDDWKKTKVMGPMALPYLQVTITIFDIRLKQTNFVDLKIKDKCSKFYQ